MDLVGTLSALDKFLDSGNEEVILQRKNVSDVWKYIGILEKQAQDLTVELGKLRREKSFFDDSHIKKDLKKLREYA